VVPFLFLEPFGRGLTLDVVAETQGINFTDYTQKPLSHPSMAFNEYRLLSHQYVLHSDDQPASRPMQQLSLAFDRVTGELHMHGEPARVQTWARLTLKRMVASGPCDTSENLVVVTGRLPLSEVNRCLQEEGYCKDFFARLMDNEFAYAPATT
jgi:hypothetical protein